MGVFRAALTEERLHMGEKSSHGCCAWFTLNGRSFELLHPGNICGFRGRLCASGSKGAIYRMGLSDLMISFTVVTTCYLYIRDISFCRTQNIIVVSETTLPTIPFDQRNVN